MNRRKSFVLFFACLLSGLIAYGTVSVINAGKVEVINQEYKIKKESSENAYMVKECMGNIGVYLKTDGKYVLSKILPSPVLSLPEADRQALKEGIYIQDKEALLMLLEDYSD